MKRKGYFFTTLIALGSAVIIGSAPVEAAEKANINDFIGYYRVDVDDSMSEYNCEVRALEFMTDGRLQEFQGQEAATTGTTIMYWKPIMTMLMDMQKLSMVEIMYH